MCTAEQSFYTYIKNLTNKIHEKCFNERYINLYTVITTAIYKKELRRPWPIKLWMIQ